MAKCLVVEIVGTLNFNSCENRTKTKKITEFVSLSGHVMKECTGEAKEKEGEFDEMANSGGMAQKDFIFIRLPVLREVSVCL